MTEPSGRDVPVVVGDQALLPDLRVLVNVHHPRCCAGRACVLHNPTEHHMRDWPLCWRGDRSIFERICRHGVGHPDPDQRAHWRQTGQAWQGVHGCDGCCRPPHDDPTGAPT